MISRLTVEIMSHATGVAEHWLFYADFILRMEYSDYKNFAYCWQHRVTNIVQY